MGGLMRNFCLATIFLCLAAFAFGQSATVTGTVTDPSGAVIGNAPVELKNTETGQIYSGASTATGNYTILQLPVGSYELSVRPGGPVRLTADVVGGAVTEADWPR